MKFVRVVEKYGNKNQYEYIYDGILLSKSKTELQIIGVGPEKNDKIRILFFDPKGVSVRESDKSTVEHYFKLSILKAENELNDAEFNLLDARKSAQDAIDSYKKHFGKEPSFT